MHEHNVPVVASLLTHHTYTWQCDCDHFIAVVLKPLTTHPHTQADLLNLSTENKYIILNTTSFILKLVMLCMNVEYEALF